MSLRRLGTLTFIWWTAQLMLALPAALAVWAWLGPRVAYSPATDVLWHGFDFATASDLLQPERAGIVTSAWAVAMLAAASSVLLSPLLVAGTLGVLRKASDRRAVGAFVVAAADPFWPLVALGVATRGVAAILAVVAALVVSMLISAVGGEFWEPGPFVSVVVSGTIGVLVWWLFVALGDLAIVLRTEAPRRSTLNALGGAAALIARNPIALAALWLMTFVLPSAAVLALYVLVSDRLLPLPALLFGAQQIVVLVRTGSRVRVLAAERRLALDLRGISMSEEDQVRPGQDREREIQQRQEPQGAVHPEQVQEHRTTDGDQFGDREARADAGMAEGVRDERVALREAEGPDSQVGENPVKGL